MATISRKVQWTLLTDPTTALQVLPPAIEQAKFAVKSLTPSEIAVDVPQALLSNQWAAKITGIITPDTGNTHVDWHVEGLGNKHYKHLIKISEGLPEGLLDDHGIEAAASQVPLRIFGRKEIAHLANVLDRSETVHAIGVGRYENKAGIAAATDRRLLFLEKSIGSEDLTSFSLGAIQAVDLKKALGGETLTVSHSGTKAVIMGLGHGQGDSLIRAIRTAQATPAPQQAAPATPTTDIIGQLERLAELKAKGILTDDEFQQQKAVILASQG
ncbi:PH domain-containing protein [Arthrobacter sp. ISL-65]|uniref:PH domain-containing protein n=1 Tax=Arthrobacter sp. ISL-65 TaxID=2819112 RepID=UPI001BE549D0|nr:PH domain-containing protein [Arthrobacter sp. ISL-65]MBT2548938.1 PH domain-containing protein [Arthrobacter sp. ISL-65]